MFFKYKKPYHARALFAVWKWFIHVLNSKIMHNTGRKVSNSPQKQKLFKNNTLIITFNLLYTTCYMIYLHKNLQFIHISVRSSFSQVNLSPCHFLCLLEELTMIRFICFVQQNSKLVFDKVIKLFFYAK